MANSRAPARLGRWRHLSTWLSHFLPIYLKGTLIAILSVLLFIFAGFVTVPGLTLLPSFFDDAISYYYINRNRAEEEL